jgi:hypothetical protein
MALTYAQTYAAINDTAFLNNVAVSLVKNAQNVITEVNTTANHAMRELLARRVLQDPDTWAKRFAINVALAPNIQLLSALSSAVIVDIDNQVSSVWNSYF